MTDRQASIIAQEVYNATASDITDNINKRMEEYEDENLYDDGELHGYFVADFHKFTIRTFKKTTDPVKHLRDFLRKKNVFIQKSRVQSNPFSSY
ncbi:putative glycosyl [Erysiphe neolycopersici]|uniref:Putative glycosyl n=1 Tax=Erysiphe neolycopersici TaxID=212602 RepID=A0A420I562_9PEZI|nr:putative glycosyl [Erysiphe neolycopersici]